MCNWLRSTKELLICNLNSWGVYALVVALLGFPISVKASDSSTKRCVVTRALPFNGSNYDPQVRSSSIDAIVYRELMDTLLHVQKDGKLNPAIASNYSIDRETNSITFQIEPSCGWSDGNPIVPEDFILSFKRMLLGKQTIKDPQIFKIVGAQKIANDNSPHSTLKIIKEGDRAFRIHLDGSPLEFLTSLGSTNFGPMPSHKMSISDEYSPLTVSSGPYMLKEKSDTKFVFKRNPHFCATLPSEIDEIVLENLSDKFEEFSKLTSGKLDVMLFPPEQQLAQAVEETKSGTTSYKAVDQTATRQVYLMMNPSPLLNRDVRKAISLVVDRDAIAERGNLAVRTRNLASSLIHKTAGYQGLSYSDEIYNGLTKTERIQKARSLTEKHGYSEQAPLKLEITTYPLEIFASTASFIAGMLRQVHIDVTYKVLPSIAEAVDQQSSVDSTELFILSWSLDYPDPMNSFHGLINSTSMDQKMEKYLSNKPAEESDYSKMGALLRQAGKEIVPAIRNGSLKDAEKVLLEELLFVPLFNPVGSYLISSDLISKRSNVYLRMADHKKLNCK